MPWPKGATIADDNLIGAEWISGDEVICNVIPTAPIVDSYVNRCGSTRRDSQSLVNEGDSDGGCDYTVGHISG
jgi:hypothetical protein